MENLAHKMLRYYVIGGYKISIAQGGKDTFYFLQCSLVRKFGAHVQLTIKADRDGKCCPAKSISLGMNPDLHGPSWHELSQNADCEEHGQDPEEASVELWGASSKQQQVGLGLENLACTSVYSSISDI